MTIPKTAPFVTYNMAALDNAFSKEELARVRDTIPAPTQFTGTFGGATEKTIGTITLDGRFADNWPDEFDLIYDEADDNAFAGIADRAKAKIFIGDTFIGMGRLTRLSPNEIRVSMKRLDQSIT